jgi:hypothetical protein
VGGTRKAEGKRERGRRVAGGRGGGKGVSVVRVDVLMQVDTVRTAGGFESYREGAFIFKNRPFL